jgi:hypothetical protein
MASARKCKNMKIAILLLSIGVLVSGCSTSLTVNKPIAEVKAGMQRMDHNLNAGLPTFAQWVATNIPPVPITNVDLSITNLYSWLTNGAVFEVAHSIGTNALAYKPGQPETNILRFNPRSGGKLPWGTSSFIELPGENLYLHIFENVHWPMNTIPLGDIRTTIEAKPAGPNRTKITVLTKKYGLVFDSRERDIEKRRRAELSDILRLPPGR